MSILARYIAREFFRLFVLCLAGFAFVYVLVDFIEQSNAFFRAHATGTQILLYFAFKSPLVVFQMIPPGVLVATLLTLAILSRHSEIVAMMAGGVSLARIVLPILALAAVLAAFSFLLNEYVVPPTLARAELIKEVEIKGRRPAVRAKRKNLWHRSGDRIYNIRLYHTQTREMREVAIFEFDPELRLGLRVDARSAIWTGEAWEFRDGVVRTFDRNRLVAAEPFRSLVLPLPERPEDFATVAKDSEEMNFRELQEFIRQVEGEGMDVTRYRVDLFNKLAFPLVGIVMALLGVPFALRGGRQGGVALGIAMAVGIGVVYWLVMGTFLSLGYSGLLPATVAAFGGHVLFGGIGAAMLARAGR